MVFNQRKTLRHSTFLPDSIRVLIVGLSNYGVTNVIFGLKKKPQWMEFKNVGNYLKSLYQTKYVYLSKQIDEINTTSTMIFR